MLLCAGCSSSIADTAADVTVAGIKKELALGATEVSLDIKKLDSVLHIPAGVAWRPPRTPLKLTPNARLYIDGPMVGTASKKIFDAKPGQVMGHFGGLDVEVGWWSGWDPAVVEDTAPYIEAAAMAHRASPITLQLWNKNLAQKYITGDITGGVVHIPSGLWPIKTTIDLGSRYVQLRGSGNRTALHFIGLGEGVHGISIKGPATNTSIEEMAWIVDPSCHKTSSIVYINSGYLEGTHFKRIFSRGSKKAIFEIRGGSSNHFRVSDCHFIAPGNPDSVALLAEAMSNQLTWHNNTVANINGAGQWAYHLSFYGYDRASVRDSHFESALVSAIRIKKGARRAISSVSIQNCLHNWDNKFWKQKPIDKSKGLLVLIEEPRANVTVQQCQVVNGYLVLRDEPHGVQVIQGGTGNKIIGEYIRSQTEFKSFPSTLMSPIEE